MLRKPGIWILSILLLCFGCVHHAVDPPPDPPAVQVPAWPSGFDPAAYFHHAPLSSEPEVVRVREHGRYSQQELRFPAFTAHFYLPKTEAASGRFPAALVLPISKGDFHARSVAAHLASHGFACLRVTTENEIMDITESSEPVDEFERNFRAYIAGILQAFDWMAAHPRVDPERMGLVGISFGAIAGVIVGGLDPRVHASVLLLGGGDIPGILTSSWDRRIIEVRGTLERHTGLTGRELEDELGRRLSPFEPLRYAPRHDPSKVLMIAASLDRVVRRRNTLALWEALHRPRLLFVPTGHYSAFLFLPYAKSKTLEHLRATLGVGP